MNPSDYNQNLVDFIQASPTPFHAVQNMADLLCSHGFTPLAENRPWQLSPGEGYFLRRADSALLAWIIGDDEELTSGFRLLAAHTDSPCLKLKPRPESKTGNCRQLAVEVYGGPLLNPWFDRDLSLAGRVCGESNNGQLVVRLVDFARPLLTIPSIAIHFDREANSGRSINQQQHLPPLFGLSGNDHPDAFASLLLNQARLEHPDVGFQEILSFDLFCADSQPPAVVGAEGEFLAAARLDNLLSCHAGIQAMVGADRGRNSLLFCANHEENGSRSSSGAHGSFLDAALERIIPNPESRQICLRNSFLISMDNAHASHPNHPDKMDAGHPIRLNHGPVIKYNANQRYATSGLSAAIFKRVCRQAAVEVQEFVMRSDILCGSTIGPITAARLGVETIDIGAATLAMHSIRELTGSSDPLFLYRAIRQFLASDDHICSDE